MKYLMLISLFALSMILNCAAAPVSLSGDSGKSILMQVSSVNITGQITKASQGDLWSWGKTPMNYEINSGKPIEMSSEDEDNIWLNSVNGIIPVNISMYQ
jgi:hypothetical protein